MAKPLTAEYDAEHNTLRLAEPLEGVKDHETVQVVVTPQPDASKPDRPWLAFSGILSKEAGDELAALVNEMFPPWDEEDDDARDGTSRRRR